MSQVSDAVRIFFENYERGTNSLDITIFAASYSDNFMFAGPNGVQPVKKDAFLKMIPQRKGFFQMLGLQSSNIVSLIETRLDEQYIQVKTVWRMHYEKDQHEPIDDENLATYILRLQNGQLQIVFQLDHQDLMKKAQTLGLLPQQS
jgi:hypothetical protein